MALGCGRLFEGTPAQMYDTLTKLSALPSDTVIYSGHEYTADNAAFAMTIEPGNEALQNRVAAVKQARAANNPTVPSLLSDELATNPFLRSHSPEVQATVCGSGWGKSGGCLHRSAQKKRQFLSNSLTSGLLPFPQTSVSLANKTKTSAPCLGCRPLRATKFLRVFR